MTTDTPETAGVPAGPGPVGSDGTPAGEQPDESGRPKRNRVLFWGAIVLGVLVLAAVVTLLVSSATGDGEESIGPADLETARVERRDLVERETFDGTLQFADGRSLSVPISGTVTSVAEEASTVDRGGTLVEIDGEPVVLMIGEIPAYRRLSTSSDDGADVRQLEENLVALGHADSSNLTVDDEYTSATANAVERWQDSLGLDETGSVDLGRVVFLPGAARVGAVAVDVGSTVGPGAPVMQVSGTGREVLGRVPTDDQDLLVEGDEVQVVLPDDTTITGTITSVGRAVQSDPSQPTQSFVEATITLSNPEDTGSLDQAPVDVKVTKSRAAGVLAVPVQALLALSEGGYALEVVDEGDGGRRLVQVEIGTFADGFVEVSGEAVTEGLTIVVAQ